MYKQRRLTAFFTALILLLQSVSWGSAVETAAPSLSTPETPPERVREVTELRETNSETYLMSDGTYECVVYPENKYYRDGDTLELIDNSLVTDAKGAGYVNAANAFDVTFSSASTAEVEMAYEGKSVTFTPVVSEADKLGLASQAVRVGSQGTAPVLSLLTQTGNNTITYTNAFLNADLTYVLANSMLKEYIILKNANAPNSFSFLFKADGVSVHTEDGNVTFRDSNGETVFALAPLFAVDANEVYTNDLTYTVTPGTGRGETIVTITLSEEFLTAEDRAFPVVVDPSTTIKSYETADASVCSATPSTNYQMAYNLRTGYEPDYGKRRSFIKFNIPSWLGNYVIDQAALRLEHLSGVAPTVRAYQVSGTWSSGSITWNTMPGHSTAYYSGLGVNTSGNWYEMTVTGIVRNWINGTSNYGFLIMDDTETDPDHWSTFYSSDAESARRPELVIGYSAEDTGGDEGGNEGGDNEGGGNEGGGEVTEPTTAPTEPPLMTFNLQLNYDNAYASRHSTPSQRIANFAVVLKNKYAEYRVQVNYSPATLLASYAESSNCTSLPNGVCSHITNGFCTNGTKTMITQYPDVDLIHHTNYTTNLYKIATPGSSYHFRCQFNGHALCRQPDAYDTAAYGLFEHYSNYERYCRGIADEYSRISMITEHNSDALEIMTFVHEFGHLIGLNDHYGGKYPSTADLNDEGSVYQYEQFCIYGEQRFDGEVVAELTLCPGCTHELEMILD